MHNRKWGANPAAGYLTSTSCGSSNSKLTLSPLTVVRGLKSIEMAINLQILQPMNCKYSADKQP